MNLPMKQKQNQRHKKQTAGANGEEVREGRSGSLGLTDVNWYVQDE